MIKAIIFDCFGVVLPDASERKDAALLKYIAQLRQQGYKTAMLSNISSEGLQRRFTAEELNTYFDAVVTSGDIGYAKPEPEAYEITADKLNVRLEDCLMIDDRELCVEGARAVGMPAILYQSFDQTKHELEKFLQNE